MKNHKITFIIDGYSGVNLFGKAISFEDTAIETRRPTSLTNAALLQAVIAAVNYVICEKENRQYRRLAFAFQAQVGNQLKRSGIDLPKPLGEYLADYPQIFRIGTHPYTHAATVSIR